MTTTPTIQREADERTTALIAAAEERATAYDGDDRSGIKNDVINAFYAGSEWERRRSRAATDQPSAGQVDERVAFAEWYGNPETNAGAGIAALVEYMAQEAWLARASLTPTAPAPIAPVEPVELMGVRDEMAKGSGFWSSCSGCYDTEDGHPTGPYSYSHVFGCALGSGCSECGGIGAVWDNTDYEAMASDLGVTEAVSSRDHCKLCGGTEGHWHGCSAPVDTPTAPQAASQQAGPTDSLYVAYGDDDAVDLFAKAMKDKMAASRAKGRSGWHDPDQCPTERLQTMLIDHLAKGDPVDIGNFAMMLWNRGEPVADVGRAFRNDGAEPDWSAYVESEADAASQQAAEWGKCQLYRVAPQAATTATCQPSTPTGQPDATICQPAATTASAPAPSQSAPLDTDTLWAIHGVVKNAGSTRLAHKIADHIAALARAPLPAKGGKDGEA